MSPDHRDTDDLFVPSVQQVPRPTEPPYRTGSMIYPAFFGGPLALLPFAVRNARRLGLTDTQRRLLLLAVLGSLAAALAVAVVLDSRDASPRAPRLSLQVAGLVAFLLVSRVMRGPERRLELRGIEFDRFGFWRGLAAVVVLGLVQGLVMTAVLGLAR